MTKYITSNDSDWLDDLDLAQLRGLSVHEADELLTTQAEGQRHAISHVHFRHLVCETSNLDDELDDYDEDVSNGASTQQEDAKPHVTHTLSQLRRDAERGQREQMRIEAHSQRVLQRLYQRRDSHQHSSPPSQWPASRSSPSNQRRRDWNRRSKSRQEPNAGTAQGDSGSVPRRHANDPSKR